MAFTSLVNSANAGGMIPVEYSDSIISQLPRQSVAVSLFTTVNMGSKTTVLPVESGLATASFIGEASPISASNGSWTGKSLIAAKLGTIVPISREVIEDSSFDFEQVLLPKVAEAFGKAIDSAVIFGTGKPAAWTENSIVSGATAASNVLVNGATSANDLAADISDTMALVESDGYDVNGFACASALKARFRNLRDSNGNPIYQPIAQGSPATIFGESAFFAKNGGWDASQALLVCGDFSKAILGVRRDITLDVLREATITSGEDSISLGQSDMVGLRFVMRVGFCVANCVTPQNVSTAYPFAILGPKA